MLPQAIDFLYKRNCMEISEIKLAQKISLSDIFFAIEIDVKSSQISFILTFSFQLFMRVLKGVSCLLISIEIK